MVSRCNKYSAKIPTSVVLRSRARPIQTSAVRILALFLIQSHFQGIVLYRGEVHSMGHDNATIARSYVGAATSVICTAGDSDPFANGPRSG